MKRILIPLENAMLIQGGLTIVIPPNEKIFYDDIQIIPRTIKKLPIDFILNPMDYISEIEHILPEIIRESSNMDVDIDKIVHIDVSLNLVDNIYVEISLKSRSDEIMKMIHTFVPTEGLKQLIKNYSLKS